MRLLSKDSIEKIVDILTAQLTETLKRIDPEMLRSRWKELPEARKSSVYAVDGSRSVTRLSGTIIYFLTASAFGSGKPYRFFYANAMQYNYGVSDQMIRMQMETMENMMGYLAGRMLKGNEKLVLMDGTLTGSLIRPPVYPEDVKNISVLKFLIGEEEFHSLIREYKRELDKHYKEVSRELKEKGFSTTPILSDRMVESFQKRYLAGKIIGHLRNKVKVKVPASVIRIEGVPISVLEKFREEGKTLDDVLREVREGRVEILVDRDTINDAFHVLLTYLEYLHSLDKLLEMENLAYVAKSFYTKRIANELGIPVVDTALLDIALRRSIWGEKEGYLEFENPIKVEHQFPEYLVEHFKNVKRFAESGVYSAYVRFERGDVIYLLQSTKRIERILPLVLYHKAGGYIRPLQLAHEGTKISYREARGAIDVLINLLRSKEPTLKVFVKYGRSPLE
ncbi:hypothetical protein PNA2_1610 [Pyrococcus sp. NA2]|uniref:DNA double-strand break repair nuclease NurA n=1 Tax=Pyrococcus sp. (strain NA2) TaxID=342949 RepID=UPI000209A9B8|nr:DNA double-strand break repair nuclease NurA [Pyrococcus sp. NA2]AEC52525.1 hypothetical protein PNA2_1610 [Pyrococcus sp. NA2]